MKYDELTNLLIKEIVELKSVYEQELEWWDGQSPGAHNIFGDVLNPYLIELLNENREKTKLKKIFKFLEEMANSEDELLKEVLACTVLERLGDDKAILEIAKRYMGESSRKISCEIEKGLGRT